MKQNGIELALKTIVTVGLALFCGKMAYWLVDEYEIGLGLLVGGIAGLLCMLSVASERRERIFLTRLLLLALGLRWLTAYLLFSRGLNGVIGPDYETYDFFGNNLNLAWQGLMDANMSSGVTDTGHSGWGMYYYVAAVYFVIGRNPLAIQLINCALGAVTCLLVYRITLMIYPLPRVARIAALITAVAPSMVLWSSQGLKESPIVLCLCLCTWMALRLCQRFRVTEFAVLSVALFCLYSLRNYAFYIVFVAIAGALLFTMKKLTPNRALQGVVLVIILGFTFVYLGASEVAQKSFDLKTLQAGRVWSAQTSATGFGGEVDVTDSRAALSYLPVGIMYVLFAPFPWEMTKGSLLLMLPEMLVWWAAFPLLFNGFWFMVRRRLLPALPICIFTIGLTLVYALLLTNVGTVARQRSQLLVFFFVFVSIGWERWRLAKQVSQTYRVRAALEAKVNVRNHAALPPGMPRPQHAIAMFRH
jgi:Dolichyl-phosphate-mannose-protein mannosyltransferase